MHIPTDDEWEKIEQLAESLKGLDNKAKEEQLKVIQETETEDTYLLLQQFLDLPLEKDGRIDDSIGTGGRYVVREKIGTGGSSEVYRAFDRNLERDVAIKFLDTDLLSNVAIDKLAQEGKILAKVNIPGIVSVFESGVDCSEGRVSLYVVLEYVKGVSLKDHAKSISSLKGKIQLVIDTCNIISNAHSFLIVHRDLKPDNIMVGNDNKPKILDFGIARHVDDDGGMEGTPEYMSPEQKRGERPDIRDDVYSLGKVAGEILESSIPREINLILNKATESDRSRRYATVNALARDLNRYLRKETISIDKGKVWRELKNFACRQKRIVASVTFMLLILIISTSVFSAYKARYDAYQSVDKFMQKYGLAIFSYAFSDQTMQREDLYTYYDYLTKNNWPPVIEQPMAESLGHKLLLEGDLERAEELLKRAMVLRLELGEGSACYHLRSVTMFTYALHARKKYREEYELIQNTLLEVDNPPKPYRELVLDQPGFTWVLRIFQLRIRQAVAHAFLGFTAEARETLLKLNDELRICLKLNHESKNDVPFNSTDFNNSPQKIEINEGLEVIEQLMEDQDST